MTERVTAHVTINIIFQKKKCVTLEKIAAQHNTCNHRRTLLKSRKFHFWLMFTLKYFFLKGIYVLCYELNLRIHKHKKLHKINIKTS